MQISSDGFDWPARGVQLRRHKAWAWLVERLQRKVTVTDGDRRYRFSCGNLLEFARASGLMQKEPGTIDWLNAELHPGDTFLDVGANVGIYTVMAAMRVGRDGRVYAFEPHGLTFASLLRNIALNDLTEVVTPACIALSESSAVTGFFYKSIEAATSNSQIERAFQPGKGTFRQVIAELKQVYSLDDLVETGSVVPPNHIKIDVDGREFDILKGMERLLRGERHPRSLSVEVYSGDDQEIAAFMEGCGYVASSENYSRTTAKKMRKDPAHQALCRNVIFRPREDRRSDA